MGVLLLRDGVIQDESHQNYENSYPADHRSYHPLSQIVGRLLYVRSGSEGRHQGFKLSKSIFHISIMRRSASISKAVSAA